MNKNRILTTILFVVCAFAHAQKSDFPVSSAKNSIELSAQFDPEVKKIYIDQTITYQNTTIDTLSTVYLNDWMESFSTKTTPLAKRFAEEFNTDIHFAKNEERGYTVITSMTQDGNEVLFDRLEEQLDVVKVTLNQPILPGKSYSLHLNYTVQVPSDKFTRYGVTSKGDYNLRYWYITPAIYNGQWQYQSNKNLDDMFIPISDIAIKITCPNYYNIVSELNVIEQSSDEYNRTIILHGGNRRNTKLFLTKTERFTEIKMDSLTVVYDLESEGTSSMERALITDQIIKFIENNLGKYPHEKLLITDIDYKKQPIYGLNQLPNFIRPFPGNFQYELKLLKTSLLNYLENTVIVNPRKDQWILDGLQVYYMMKYVDEYYPRVKMLGGLANIWGIRTFHAADLAFNDQYFLAYMNMARTNRDQPLSMQKDSLLKFNANIANKYKAGIGFKYLNVFLEDNTLDFTLKSFVSLNSLKQTNSKEFEDYLKSRSAKNIDWFFNDYVSTRDKLDFTIKKLKKSQDSVSFTIKNKYNNNVPVTLYRLKKDSIISKEWIENITDEKTFTIPTNGATKLALNYENSMPEFNMRDNQKSLKNFLFNNKPIQVRLFKDVEDPNYNQVFLMPIIEFNNIYDGLTLGGKIYNKTILRKHLNYKFEPQYSLNSKTITGSASIYNIHDIENRDLYFISYGFAASYQSYAEDLFVRRFYPAVNFAFRDKDDFRSNKRQLINLRFLDISRDDNPNFVEGIDEPDYSVFDAQYIFSDDNLINLQHFLLDFQLSKTFGKLSFNYKFRHLYENNRQFSLRLFAGTFLYNNNPVGFDYFSFALDRPTDYLFDYNYLGRSEASGIFSQQLIIAEGGFKSKLQPAYANQWITTANLSTSIWRYFQVYGDLGLVKNRHQDAKVVYDSGFRLNLVQDYFEIYFPVYSNLGWEISQAHYAEKIRFIFTVDPQTLLGLFRRKWY